SKTFPAGRSLSRCHPRAARLPQPGWSDDETAAHGRYGREIFLWETTPSPTHFSSPSDPFRPELSRLSVRDRALGRLTEVIALETQMPTREIRPPDLEMRVRTVVDNGR